ncbi:hypothetical protein FFK22_009175 [Mycobacterium sp. KBS0706]|uniref:hypothetical protein n=1 Tax=Mycobacterium sp. KBS0706 TaxID=2578109 RepID=UPI00110FA44D|nr:hypothetical protein [Mycobacterium sp. KBS0706]TSD89135.1 hypothetical protein FFK22_009175 [Mycobacterium sp. KBS0706]
MRFGVVIAAAVAVWLGLGATPASAQFDIHFFAIHCEHDDEIAAGDRTAIEQAGLDFARRVVDGDLDGAYGRLTPEAAQAMGRDSFDNSVRSIASQVSPFQDPAVRRTLLLTGAEKGGGAMPCGTFDPAEGKVTVRYGKAAKQGYAVIEGKSGHQRWTFVLWMIAGPDWRVAHFQVALTTIAGRSVMDLLNAARSERDKGHAFTTFLLYDWAGRLVERGPNLQIALQSEIRKEADAAPLQRPKELQGAWPRAWSLGGQTFTIGEIGPYDVGGELFLKLVQDVGPWTDDADADRRNRDLIQAFTAAFPDDASAFAGLVVFARDVKGNRLHRTIDRRS